MWVEEHDKRSFLLDLMDASGLGAKDLDGEASRLLLTIIVDMIYLICKFFLKDSRLCGDEERS